MKKLLFIIIFISISSFGQKNTQKDTLYLDENQVEITKTKYNSKMNNSTLYARSYETKDLIIYKVLYKYYFGEISHTEYNQINKLLEKDANVYIANDATILIKFTDTLYSYKYRKKRYDFHTNTPHYFKPLIIKPNSKYKDSLKVKHKPFNYSVYKNNIKKYSIKQRKCSKKLLKRKNTYAIHVYNINKGYDFNKNLKWVKDRILKKAFFKNMYESNILIIKPNGDYFMKYGHLSDSNLFKLLKENDWTQYKMDWKKSLETNSKKGFGFIKKLTEQQNNKHIPHCY